MPARVFECHCHPNKHEAEVFVEVVTIFSSEAFPMCRAAVKEFIESTLGQHGIRQVSALSVEDYSGTISGVLSTR